MGTVSTQLNENALLLAYKRRVTDELYNSLMEDIKPKLRAAAEEATKQLQGAIQQQLDPMSRDLLVRVNLVITEGSKP